MVNFDLHKALEGAPVKLRGGGKAFVYASMPNHVRETLKYDKNYVLVGAIIESSGECLQPLETWTEDGSYIDDEGIPSNSDIVGMW
jgi:hypothetical protein